MCIISMDGQAGLFMIIGSGSGICMGQEPQKHHILKCHVHAVTCFYSKAILDMGPMGRHRNLLHESISFSHASISVL